jgi:hypothetical protein
MGWRISNGNTINLFGLVIDNLGSSCFVFQYHQKQLGLQGEHTSYP